MGRWLIIIFCSLVGAMMLSDGIGALVTARHTCDWPSVPGTVVSSRISIRYSKGASYRPEISYDYQAEGSTHRGTSLWILDCSDRSKAWAETALAGLQPGATVRVFYEPSKPFVSVLKRGYNRCMVINCGIGVAFLVGGVWNFVLWRKQKGRSLRIVP